MPLTPAERTVRARLAAFSQHAQYDVRETTRAARTAFEAKFLLEADPTGELSVTERERRAAALKKAYFQKLTLKRLRAKSAKKRETTEQNSVARTLTAGGGEDRVTDDRQPQPR